MKLETTEIEALRELLLSNQNNINPTLKKLLKRMKPNSSTYKMYIDGAADLNTQTSGIGGIIYKDGEEIFTFSEYLHDLTNNEAEYSSLIHGLKSLLKLSILNIVIYSDSELVVKQINGEYKVKNSRMRKLYDQTHSLLANFQKWQLLHVLRDKNTVADKLATEGRLKNNL
mgnify:FL=1